MVQQTCDDVQVDSQVRHAGWLQLPQQGVALGVLHVPPPGAGAVGEPVRQMTAPSPPSLAAPAS
jgi:hypothetical protein